jgi:hypothetical protein
MTLDEAVKLLREARESVLALADEYESLHLSVDIEEKQRELARRIDAALAEPVTDTNHVVELEKPVRLRNGQTVELRVTTPAPPVTFSIGHPPVEEESAEVWVLRLCDLVGQDGSNERGRLEAFALLHDAVKTHRTNELVWTAVDNQLQYANLPSKKREFDANEGQVTLRVSPRSGVKGKWCWDLTNYGYADTEAEAKEAAIKASKGLR